MGIGMVVSGEYFNTSVRTDMNFTVINHNSAHIFSHYGLLR